MKVAAIMETKSIVLMGVEGGNTLSERNAGQGCDAEGFEVSMIEVHGMTKMGGEETMGWDCP